MGKKKIKPTKGDTQVYYVGISEAIPVRRSILEASKELVQSLQQYDRFSVVRASKKGLIADVRKSLKGCALDLSKLKKILPVVQPAKNVPKPRMKKKPEPVQLEEPEDLDEIEEEYSTLGKKEANELAKLEKELNEIESKLGEM